ncbi:MAG TPA: Ku protein [Candidatus Sulfotelmatobacter sp.]|nr:Ku protein [Candidatus Sulfotelmatobacter sp.]
MSRKSKTQTIVETGSKSIIVEKPSNELATPVPRRPIWSGTLSIGLISVPVKLYPMIYDRGVSFHFLHKTDGQPLKYERVCTKDGKIVPWDEVVKGYEVSKNEYLIFDKKELEAAKPESDRRIHVDKFVDYFSIDPIYFSTSYILTPDKSNDAYNLLLIALQRKNKACTGRITLRTKEYPAIVHAYKDALVLTTMRYSYDVVDPRVMEDLKNLETPDKTELEIAIKIVNELSGEFDITDYKDTYREKIKELIQKKKKGEKIIVEKPVKEEAKELMTALRETLKQLENK